MIKILALVTASLL